MMMLKDIIDVLDVIAPFDTAEQWDNVGLMVGDPKSEVNAILISLDPTFDAIEEAINNKAELVITHHPLVFKPISFLNMQEILARKIALLIKADINLISMHTNLDKAPGGVADLLAERIGLRDVQSFGAMRLGSISMAVPLKDWTRKLSIQHASIIDCGRAVKTVALCPGSGMDYFSKAVEMGCDTFVTGDVRYHAGLDAKETGINIIDLGHFETEQGIVASLARRLKKELKHVEVFSHRASDVFSLYNN